MVTRNGDYARCAGAKGPDRSADQGRDVSNDRLGIAGRTARRVPGLQARCGNAEREQVFERRKGPVACRHRAVSRSSEGDVVVVGRLVAGGLALGRLGAGEEGDVLGDDLDAVALDILVVGPAGVVDATANRSEARRVGQAWVSTCRSRWSPTHTKKK